MVQCISQGPIAQRLEQGAHNSLVAGSIPAGPICRNKPRHTMHDSEQHPLPDPTDEQDVEIVDLDTPAALAHATQPKPSPLAPRFTARQRRTQLIATVSITLLVLLVFLGSY